NPADGSIVGVYKGISDRELFGKIEGARQAFVRYRRMPMAERARLMHELAGLLERDTRDLAGTAALEMGKLVRAGDDEVLKCAWCCRFYADHAARLLADEVVTTNARRSFVRYQPLGPILAVMPWNFPFWQVFRFAVPALIAGNVALLKHASNVPKCA